jgi:pilus assembly protein Flp/PilA
MFIKNNSYLFSLFSMKKLQTNFWKDQSGQSMTEYALILAVVAVAAVAVMTTMGDKIQEAFQSIVDAF